MKKILLLILGVILFAGCVGNTQTDDENMNTTYSPGQNNEIDDIINTDGYENENLNENVEEETENNELENEPETLTDNDGITYCKVDMGGGLTQEYFFSQNEVRLYTSIEGEWNEITLTPTQSCAKSSDVPGEEVCSPITNQEFTETKEGWKIGAQQMGTCN
jgi:hypothetical protein